MNWYVASLEKIENACVNLAAVPLGRTKKELMDNIKIRFRNRNWSQFTHDVVGWRAIMNSVM
jgi:hypothetical protein